MVSVRMRRWIRHASLAATILAAPLGGSTQGVRSPDVAAWDSYDPYYVMVYRSAIEGPKDRYEIRSQVVSRDGRPLGASKRVFDPGSRRQALEPRIAFSPVNRSFALIWVDRERSSSARAGSWSVRYRRLDPRGRPVGRSRRISERSRHRLSNPKIVWGRSSNAYFGVVWREKLHNRIEGRAILYDGEPHGRVVTIVKSRAFVSAPAITGDKGGWFSVAWTRPGWSRQAIYVREFRSSGLHAIHRVPGIDPRQLFEDPGEHVTAQADEPQIGFDFKRYENRLAWTVHAYTGQRHAGAVAAIPIEQTSHEPTAKPVLLARDPPGRGASYELRMFRRDRAPATDLAWWHIGKTGGCFDFDIRHRLVTVPWHAVGPAPETLSSADDPSGPPDRDGCKGEANHPAVTGTYADPPNTLYAWESGPYIVGVVR
jgi:hypothetical protein